MQVQRVANAAPALPSLKALADLAQACRTLVASQLHAYRPEKHYMRGPGPKWREKHARNAAAAQQ
jgi:hypothetical protein